MKLFKMLLVLLAANSVFAASGGYNNDASDTRAIAMSCAVAARDDLASANWFNPAGIVRIPESQTEVSLVYEHTEFEMTSDASGRTIDMEEGDFFIPSIFYTKNFGNSWAAGIGLNSPYGLVTDWNDPEINYVATKTVLQPLILNPNAAFAVNDRLSLAAGIDLVYAKGSLGKNLNQTLLNSYLYSLLTNTQAVLVSPDGSTKLEGSDTALGGNAALMYKISETVQAGLTYRSRVDLDIEGELELSGLSGPTALVFGGADYKTDASVCVPIPAAWVAAVAFKPADNLTLELDIEYAEWSAVDEFDVNIKGESDPSRLMILNSGNPINKDWEDTWNFSLGAELGLQNGVTLYAGTRYRPTPVPEETFDPSIPSMDVFDITGGFTIKNADSRIDLSIDYAWSSERDVKNTVGSDVMADIDGKYSLKALLLCVSWSKKI